MIKKLKKSGLFWGVLTAASMFFLINVSYAEFPSKPITVLVGWAVGGLTDTTTRSLCAVSERYLPVATAVLNRPGAGGSIAQSEMVRATPDGHTLIMNTGSCLFIEPHIKNLPYKETDYVIVMQVFSEDSIVAAHPDTPYNNMREMMEYAKANPKTLKFGVHAPLTTGHLAALQLQLEHDVEFKILPMGRRSYEKRPYWEVT